MASALEQIGIAILIVLGGGLALFVWYAFVSWAMRRMYQ